VRIASDIEVKFIRPGDVVLDNGEPVYVRSVKPGSLDLIVITGVNMRGRQHVLRLDKQSTIKIVEEA